MQLAEQIQELPTGLGVIRTYTVSLGPWSADSVREIRVSVTSGPGPQKDVIKA